MLRVTAVRIKCQHVVTQNVSDARDECYHHATGCFVHRMTARAYSTDGDDRSIDEAAPGRAKRPKVLLFRSPLDRSSTLTLNLSSAMGTSETV